MIKITFNASAAIARLDQARAVLTDMTPVNRDIGEYMIKATRDRFPAGTAPDGTRWRQKSPTTLANYLRRGDGPRPNPLIGPSGRLGREIALLVTRDAAEIGSALEYSAVMQEGAAKGAFGRTRRGGPIPWGDIPARVWLGISAKDESTIIEIVDEHLAEAVGE